MGLDRIYIRQGEHAVSDIPEQTISTVLGSCVSCCLWDPASRVGGMNHMLLTVNKGASGTSNVSGINAMELLINDILKRGGRRDKLRAKAFGGARMIPGLSDIGRLNGQFVLQYLERESIPCEGHSLGGDAARRILFWPTTGQVMQKIDTSPDF